MSHPDDGMIEALLDGELSPAEQGRIEAHIAACVSCNARLAEARAFMGEADQLVEVLTVPDRAAGTLPRPRRRVLLRNLAWAASIVMAVGIGYWGRGAGPTAPVQSMDSDLASKVATAPSAAPVHAADEAPVPAAKQATPSAPAAATGGVARERANEATPPPQTAERELQDVGANAPAMKRAQAPESAAPTWQVISMEEAVRVLGGQIRLIDGLTPDRVESGPGTAVAGADPSLALVRVVYASGSVLLDQQRPTIQAADRQEAAAGQVGAAARTDGAGWQEREGVRFVVTGTVSPDSIRELVQRVR